MHSFLPFAYQIDKLARTFVGSFSGAFSADERELLPVGAETAPVLRNGADVLNLNFSAIDSFSAATGDIGQMTQQNAALVEQAATATGSLQHEAEKQVEQVGAFKLAQRG